MALVAIAVLSNGELLMTLAAAFFGLLLGTVGTDVTSGVTRFAFGLPGLYDGLSFVAVAVGLFAFAEVMTNMGEAARPAGERPPIRGLIPSRADVSAAWRPVLRGTAIGAGLGILPGTGPLLSSFASYAMEKQISRQPGRFGNGAIEGVAGPEAANNAAALTHFIPMLTLGIPAGSAMALMLGALIIQGITPGPQVMTEHPDLFWGLVASMWIGNLMLLVLNLPLIGIWVRLLSIPYRLIYPAVLIFCCIGVYSVNNSTSDVLVAAVFGLIGVFLKRIGCTPAPVLLGLILGQLLEENFRRSLLMSGGDMSVFVTHPISLGFLLIAIALPVWIWLRGRRGPASGATRAEFLH
jgi:TctA family transporter